MPRNGLKDGHILPAYDTKHLETLHYDLILPTIPKQDFHVELLQDDTVGSTTGTTLWLGGQVLAAYLLSIKKITKSAPNPRAIDLGSGIGYTAILLAAFGYNVTATDLPILTEGVLAKNIEANRRQLADLASAGSLQCFPLDWTVDEAQWHDTARKENYDLIFSSDSIYQAVLVKPLLRTIHTLCKQSSSSSPADTTKSPDIYIAYEHRDDAQYTSFTSQAEEMGFKIKVVPKGKVGKAVNGLYGWKPEVYEGITVLQMKLAS